MKLSISNIGWGNSEDHIIYKLMKKYNYLGLEIAPTRIFPENPYDRLNEANAWAKNLKKQYCLAIPSMQSIWFKRQEKLFGTDEERQILIDYTKKAINFASAIACNNLVFGCPRNRAIPENANPEKGIEFFREISNYAAEKGTVIGMEANPLIYDTNYINDTRSALELIEQVGEKGFRLNLDVGTMIQNKEDVKVISGKVHLINHVHISEPGLKPIEQRQLHYDLKKILLHENYQGFISIEMGRTENISIIKDKMQYVREIFN